MKIAIIGASGTAGSLIAGEALRRGHDVTAVVRRADKITAKGMKVIQKDLYDLAPEDLRNFDAVVDAFGTPFTPGAEEGHKTSMAHLISVFKELPEVRLLVVGGAGSLFTSPERNRRVAEDIPAEWQGVPTAMGAAFESLKESEVNWTYFSPAPNFDARGGKTGRYALGGDIAMQNNGGEAYISYADYAVAMVDEIENKKYVRARFTAAGERGGAEMQEPYYGIEKRAPKFEGISRYRPPHNFELVGKKLYLVMDGGTDITIDFVSGSRLEWAEGGEPAVREAYECAKLEGLVYFVNFEFAHKKPRTNITLVVDLELRLVTKVKTYTRFHEKYPNLVESEFAFGAIDMPGFKLPVKRHGYTTDLVGKRIHWHYAPEWSIIHVYYHAYFMRGTFTPDMIKRMSSRTPEQMESWKDNPYDEKTAYIKIRHGVYLVSCIEQSMARRGVPGNSLLFLMDTERVHDVGRSFGHSGQFGGEGYLPENYLFGAYGEFVYSDGEIEKEKTFYVV